ncbi:YCF48-related protein [Paraburkholderia fungorum]|uniref:WD40/YVTN/BNR-like repeat-containing protein n=1 Tax=Paraburkholderia fungorum TaxID=134537 RepID=UPI0038B8C2F5
MMPFGASRAGSRIVAVGEHGLVLLSDDNGHAWRQAKHVPIDATLSSVTFSGALRGWAVGQWGTILATDDGGETWREQRLDTSTDQPLFSVAFTDERNGFAVGLWSLLLVTHDGGLTWTRTKLPKPPSGAKPDLNLYCVFGDRGGAVYIAAEQGSVIRSTDGGANWTYLETGGKGSLWAGTATSSGRIVVGGLLGSLFESTDGGATWSPLHSGTSSSITGIVGAGDGLLAVGLDGVMLRARPGSTQFEAVQRADRAALTAAVIDNEGRPVLFSKEGILEQQ